MPRGVEKTKKTMIAVSDLVADLIAIAHSGFNAKSLPKAFELITDIKHVIEADPIGAFPELKELDAAESAELGGIVYACVAKIIEQARSKPAVV